MPFKDIEKRKAAIRKHYYENRESYLEKNRKRRVLLRNYVRQIKESKHCSDCGKTYPYFVMDFDHLDGKEYLISKLVLANNRRRLDQEIAKCEVVCANCHRVRTFNRMSK